MITIELPDDQPTPSAHHLESILLAIDGLKRDHDIPTPCAYCSADLLLRLVHATEGAGSVWDTIVCHDDECPVWIEIQAARAEA